MERRVSTRFEKYWTESGRGNGQGDVEKKDNQLYRRPYMMGKDRGKEEEEEDEEEDERRLKEENEQKDLGIIVSNDLKHLLT